MTARARARWIIFGASAVGLSININIEYHMSLLQWHLKINAVPTTDEDFTIIKASGRAAEYDVELYRFSPAVENITDIIVECNWEFLPDDNLQIGFANTDTNNVAVEVIMGGRK